MTTAEWIVKKYGLRTEHTNVLAAINDAFEMAALACEAESKEVDSIDQYMMGWNEGAAECSRRVRDMKYSGFKS